MKTLILLLLFPLGVFSQAPLLAGYPNRNKVDIMYGTPAYYVPAIIYLPSDYFTRPVKRYPLIFSFHGVEEQGTDTVKILTVGLMNNIYRGEAPVAVADGVTYEAIVVAAQRSSYSVQEDWFKGMFQDITSRFRVDSSMVYFYSHGAGDKAGIGIVSNLSDADTNYTRFITAIYARSPYPNDITWSGVRKIADRNIHTILLSGTLNTGGENTYRDNAWRIQDTLNNYYSLSDTILLAGEGYDTISLRTTVELTDRYPKMDNKNIYEWFFLLKTLLQLHTVAEGR